MAMLTGCPSSDDGPGAEGDASVRRAEDAGDVEDARNASDEGDASDERDASEGEPGDVDSGTVDDDAGEPGETDAGPEHPFTGNGITGVMDGTEIRYTTNVALFPNANVPGLLQLEASGDSPLQKWRIFVPGEVGSYTCDDEGDVTVLQYIDALDYTKGGVGSGLGSCTVEVQYNADGEIYGTFSAELEGTQAGVLHTVTDGYFHYSLYDGPTGGSGLGAQGTGASFLVNGQRYTYELAAQLAFETFTGMSARPGNLRSPGSPVGLQLHTIPNELGSHDCGDGAAYRGLNVWFFWKGKYYQAGARQSPENAGPAGSSCTVDVSTIGSITNNYLTGTFAGTFHGTFVTQDGLDAITVTDGEFRVVVPQ